MKKQITSKVINELLTNYKGTTTKIGYKGKLLTKRAKRRIRKSKNLAREEQLKQKHAQFETFAQEIENQLPKSEIWFRSLYEKHYKIESDKYNQVFHAKYIPDLINKEYKYIIEIDGSIHDLERVSKKDQYKDYFYRVKGYKVFRLKAYDVLAYIKLIQWLYDIRGHLSLPTNSFKQFVSSVGLDYTKIINNSY